MFQWIVGVVIVAGVIFFIFIKLNRRTCMLAYGQGVDDAGSLSWDEIVKKYDSFLKPIRPMDAAAYQRGLEYSLHSTANSNWEDLKQDFISAYSSGAITREGTSISIYRLQAIIL